MSADRIKRRMKAGCAAIALMALAAPLAFIDMPQASAQAMMRVTPNLNVQPRIPTVNPTIAPRIDPNIAARANTVTSVDRVTSHAIPTTTTLRIGRVNPNSTMPYARFSPNLYPACDAAHRDGDGECKGTPAASGDGGNGKSAKGKGKSKGPNSNAPTTISLAFPNQLVAELDAALSEEQIRDVARRGGMELVEYQKFPLIDAFFFSSTPLLPHAFFRARCSQASYTSKLLFKTSRLNVHHINHNARCLCYRCSRSRRLRDRPPPCPQRQPVHHWPLHQGFRLRFRLLRLYDR
jgi:hypothetical protein